VTDSTISDLPVAVSITGSDILPVVAGGVLRSATVSQIASAVTVPAATTSVAGTMSAADKVKLDGLIAGGISDGDKGDLTVSSSGTVWAVDAGVITNNKLADVATATFKGRLTDATGTPEDLTGSQATTLLSTFTSGLKGLAPASGGGSSNFLRADGAWATPAGGSSTDSFIYQNADRTLASTTALQKIFDQTANGRLTLPEGLYEVVARLYMTGMSATTGNASIDMLGAGTAVVSGALLESIGFDNNTPLNTGARSGSAASGAATMVLTTGSTGTGLVAFVIGHFLLTTAGTIIPSVALDTAAAATLKAGTYFRVRRIASATTFTSGDAD